MKPVFSNKDSYDANIKLNDKVEIIQNDKKVAGTLNGFFLKYFFQLKFK